MVYRGSRGVLLHAKPILEDHALHDRWHVMCGASPMPPLRSTLRPCAHHRQHRDAGETAAGLVRAEAHGGQRGCPRMGRPPVAPEVGGAIIGDDPKKSVCNQWNQTWDVKNLFLCDGAPFASNADKNPTLTIMALSWRAADYLAAEAKKGNL